MTYAAVRDLHAPYSALRSKLICQECETEYPCNTIIALGPDLLNPRIEKPPTKLADGTEVWHSDQRTVVTLRSHLGEMSQVVEGFSLVEDLKLAAEIPLTTWLEGFE